MTDMPLIPEERMETYANGWVDSIAMAAEAALMAIVDVAAANDVELPSRQIIYTGTVPKDCEQVAVSVSNYGFGRPGDPMAGPSGNDCWLPGVVTITAEITRCVPETNQVKAPGRYATGIVNLPASVAMEDHARSVMRDMMVLLESGNVASNYPYEAAGTEASVLVANPEGGYQSVFLSLTMQV